VKLISKNFKLCDHNPPTLQTDRQTDGQTDRQTTCDRNTALCTKVHRAVKMLNRFLFTSEIVLPAGVRFFALDVGRNTDTRIGLGQ